MKIITKKISDNKRQPTWYRGKVIAQSGNNQLRVTHYLEYKGLEGADALELIKRECKSDIKLVEAYDLGYFTMRLWPDFMINDEIISAGSYEEAIEEFEEYIKR